MNQLESPTGVPVQRMVGPRYPGCCVWKYQKGGAINWQIAWPNGNPKWDGGIEWLATFREKKDAEEFVQQHGGEWPNS